MRFPVTIDQDEAGYYVIECPSLPGCVSQGRTREEALGHIQDAIHLSLTTRRARGLAAHLDTTEVEVALP